MMQFLVVCLVIFFLSLIYLHYQNTKLNKKIKDLEFRFDFIWSALVGLTEILIHKEVVCDEDFKEYTLTGKVQKKNNDSKTTV